MLLLHPWAFYLLLQQHKKNEEEKKPFNCELLDFIFISSSRFYVSVNSMTSHDNHIASLLPTPIVKQCSHFSLSCDRQDYCLLLFVVCCLLFVVIVVVVVIIVGCQLFVVCCLLLFVVCCLFVVCLFVDCLLIVC
jgi:hypothetical protein